MKKITMPPKKFEKPPGLTDIRGKYTKKLPDASLSFTNLHVKPRVKQTIDPSHQFIDSQTPSRKSSRLHSLAVSTPYLPYHNGSNNEISMNDVSYQTHAHSNNYGPSANFLNESELPIHSLVNSSGMTTVAILQDGRVILPQMPDQVLDHPNSYFSDGSAVYRYPSHMNLNSSINSLNKQPIFQAPIYQTNPSGPIVNRLAPDSHRPEFRYDADNNEIVNMSEHNNDTELEQLLQDISNQLLLSAKQKEQRPSCLPLPVSSILVQNDPEDPLGMRHKLPAQFRSFERYLEGKFGMDEQPAGNLEEISASNSRSTNSKKKTFFSHLNAQIRSASPIKGKISSKTVKNKARMECPLPKVPIISPSFDRPSISTVNPSNLAVLAADSFNHTADSFSSLSTNSTNPYPLIIGDEYASSPSETSETYSYISDCPSINETSIFRGTLTQSNSHIDKLDDLSHQRYPSTDAIPNDLQTTTMLIRPGPNRSKSSQNSPQVTHFSHLSDNSYQRRKFSEGSAPQNHHSNDHTEEEPTYQNLIHSRWEFSFPMVVFRQLPELIWTDCEFWYSKFKDFLEADYNSNVELPIHWSTGRSGQGRLYLAHDETRQTTWFHPVLGPRVPFGWERVDTVREGVYYHNVFVRHSQRHHPNLWIVVALKVGQVEEENCFKVLRSLQHKSKPNRDISETSRQYYLAKPGIHEQKFTLNVRMLSVPTLMKVNDDLDELFYRELKSIIVAYETYRSAIVKELSKRRLQLDHHAQTSMNSSGDKSNGSTRHKPPQIAYNATSSEAQLHRVHETGPPPSRYSQSLKDVDSSDWSSDDEDSV